MKFKDYQPQKINEFRNKSEFEIMELVLYDCDGNIVHSTTISKYEYKKNQKMYKSYTLITSEFDEKTYQKYLNEMDVFNNTKKDLEYKFIFDLANETYTSIMIVQKAINLLDMSLSEFTGESFERYINDQFYNNNQDITTEEWIFLKRVEFLKDYIEIIK